MRRVHQGQLIAEALKYAEEGNGEHLAALCLAKSEADLKDFATKARDRGDNEGAIMAALFATLTPAGLRAVTRRIGELRHATGD